MIDRWLEQRRLGQEQTDEAIFGFVAGILDGSITRAQAATWLAFVVVRGMTEAETVALTRAMTESGTRLSWPNLTGPFVDKHSTGGVGDKVSLILAPLWAALGKKVPMISGRGLGLTGGTLDKLESIPDYDTALDEAAMRRALESAGCFITGQTETLVPADRFLYSLRDETGTVASVPLITASILSKKLAEGLDALVLDVKFGSGAFMKSYEEAELLANSLQRVGEGAGLRIRVELSDMNQPLGRCIGNALEVTEAIEVLSGGGDPKLRELVLRLAGDETASTALQNGSALEHFHLLLRAHGADPEATLLGEGCAEETLLADRSGPLRGWDAQGLAQAAFDLGAGRCRASDSVDPGVGIRLIATSGDSLQVRDPLLCLVHRQGRGLERARHVAEQALQWSEGAE